MPSSRMFFAVCLLLMGLGQFVRAQQQEEKLVDRLKRGPNSNLTYDTSQSSFGSRTAQAGKVAKTSDFNGTRAFLSREYISKPFGESEKRSWFSTLFFPAKSASTSGKYEIPNAATQYATKESPTREATGASKVAGTNAFAATDLHYFKRNRFDVSPRGAPPQDKAVGYTGDLRPMSIDDVRELLNKNK